VALRSDLSFFAQEFLIQEEVALKKAGLNEQAVKRILWAASLLRDSLATKPDSEKILAAMGHFQLELSDAAKTAQEQGNKAESAKTLQKWGYRIGGVMLIMVDASTLIQSGAVSGLRWPLEQA
jgi:hypothetical protein